MSDNSYIKVLGVYEEINNLNFKDFEGARKGLGLIGSVSDDVGDVKVYYTNYGKNYVIALQPETYYGELSGKEMELAEIHGQIDVVATLNKYPQSVPYGTGVEKIGKQIYTEMEKGVVKNIPPTTELTDDSNLEISMLHTSDIMARIAVPERPSPLNRKSRGLVGISHVSQSSNDFTDRKNSRIMNAFDSKEVKTDLDIAKELEAIGCKSSDFRVLLKLAEMHLNSQKATSNLELPADVRADVEESNSIVDSASYRIEKLLNKLIELKIV